MTGEISHAGPSSQKPPPSGQEQGNGGECDQWVVLLLHSRVDDVGHGADEEEESDCEDLEEGRDAHEVESVAE